MFGLIGAALLYGDGMITPAISVLSAVEGLEVASRDFEPYTMPRRPLSSSCSVQQFGTAAVGSAFGPVMMVWFFFIARIGIFGIGKPPRARRGRSRLRPNVSHSQRLGQPRHPRRGFPLRDRRGGDVRRYGPYRPRTDPHRLDRDGLAGSLLNYAGQTALPAAAADNPFFALVPLAALSVVGLATLATVIASQAIITGASR